MFILGLALLCIGAALAAVFGVLWLIGLGMVKGSRSAVRRALVLVGMGMAVCAVSVVVLIVALAP